MHLGVLLDHPAPLVAVEVLEVEPLAVRAVGQDDRVLAGPGRPVDVGPEDDAVVHRNGDVPVDAHPIADLAGEVAQRWLASPLGPKPGAYSGAAIERSTGVPAIPWDMSLAVRKRTSPSGVASAECTTSAGM